MLELTSEGRITTWSLEQLGQAMSSPAAEASMEDLIRDKGKKEKEGTALLQGFTFSPLPLQTSNHPFQSRQQINSDLSSLLSNSALNHILHNSPLQINEKFQMIANCHLK